MGGKGNSPNSKVDLAEDISRFKIFSKATQTLCISHYLGQGMDIGYHSIFIRALKCEVLYIYEQFSE